LNRIEETELILNADRSVYHLNLKPGDLATTIITVGDPHRVQQVSKYFDVVELTKERREFVTHTGTLNGKQISVCSTGMGTDNIDIFLNEVDALFNIDLHTRIVKNEFTKLNFVRIGTSGALQKDIILDSYIATEYAIGFDTLMQFYLLEELDLDSAIKKHLIKNKINLPLYTCEGNTALINKFSDFCRKGITITNPGFYGPQSRVLRLPIKHPKLMNALANFRWDNKRITNLEMETAGIYSLAKLLGHNAVSLNAMIANRASKQFSNKPADTVENLIKNTLERLVEI